MQSVQSLGSGPLIQLLTPVLLVSGGQCSWEVPEMVFHYSLNVDREVLFSSVCVCRCTCIRDGRETEIW